VSTAKEGEKKGTAAAQSIAPTSIVPVPKGQLPANLLDAYKDVIAGSQQDAAAMTRADFSMPFLGVVQSNSPQRDKQHAKFIQGAEEGDIFNTVTNELFKGTVAVIPVRYEMVFNVWRPRDLGGGFLGSFPVQEDAVKAAIGFIMTELNDVKDEAVAREIALRRDKTGWVRDTMNQYVIAQSNDGSWAPALLSLTSTKLTPGRKWNTFIQMRKPSAGRAIVRWNDVWSVVTVQQKNDDGVFYNLKVPEPAGETTVEQWKAAADFFSVLKSGIVKVEYEKAAEEEDTPVDDGKGAKF